MLRTLLTIIIMCLDQNRVVTIMTKIECGYKQCPQTRDGALNVHIISHSHMDAGWVKTFDEYYYGTRAAASTANVQLIYHSVLSELLHDKRRRFTFSETAYFWRWWKEQRPATRSTFRSLVQEGRIEFAGGGWVQNDEATLDYLQIIDLYTWGLRKLNDTLGPCGRPKAAWQIDAYGHSREQTSLLAQMGFDGLFLGRVDHKERQTMIDEDRMEFMWRGSDVLGKMSDIMTHTLYNLYNAPEGFCFDFLCSDEPIVDDPDNRLFNADKRVNDFIGQIERQAKYYDHDNIMVLMGGDFTYQSAANWFMNIDKLINHVNSHPANISDVNIFYSTPSCYLKALYLYGRRDKAVYTERGDHFPYGSDKNTYWTGFYTSRPSFKYLIRKTHVFLQIVKQLTVIARMGDSFELHLLRHAASLVLHHDAVTGTSQQHVINDFIRTLSEAVELCSKKVSNMFSYLTPTWGGSRRSTNNQQFVVCHQLNMSQCRFTETQETIVLLVYNPLSVKTYHHVRLPAIALHYSIRDFNDEEVEYQLVPLPAAVINLPGRTSTVIQELCFEAENIPPLGFVAYYVSQVRDQLEENEYAKKGTATIKNPPHTDQELIPYISNEYIKVSVNKESGLLESIQHVDGAIVALTQNYGWYSRQQQRLQSGAYSFRPETNRPTPVTEKATYHTVSGVIVKEIRQRFSDWITQIIRLYRGEEFVELEWIIGPIPIGTDLGKEVVTIFQTNVTNSGVFYTDSNARQMIKRTCWNESAGHQQKKPVAACYVPVTSKICIQSLNTSTAVCVLTDRAQGGTSYNEGEIELMVHRRLLTDDGFGLEEPLNEEAYGVGLIIRGKHRIVLGNFRQEVEELTFNERVSQAARRWHLEPWLFMTPGDKINRRKWTSMRNKRFSALRNHGLPRNIHILTLEPWKGGSILLRLENTLEEPVRGHLETEKASGPQDFAAKSSHITVQLGQLFQLMRIRAVRETTLAANQWLDDARQMDWSTRYVYSGADDEVLAEDSVDYRDEVRSATPTDTPKEAASDSDEEETVSKSPVFRRRRIKTSRQNLPEYEDSRRKRSANNSENTANIIDGQVNEFSTEIPKGIVEESLARIYNATVTVASEMSTLKRDLARPVVTKSTPKSRSNTWNKPAKFLAELDRSLEEETYSEEHVSTGFKKRVQERKEGKNFKKRDPDTVTYDFDDSVTKSMYEMYYKSRARNPFRTDRGHSEEFEQKYRRSNKKMQQFQSEPYYDLTSPVPVKRKLNKYYEEVPSSTEGSRRYTRNYRKNRRSQRRGKMLNGDMPLIMTDGGNKYKMMKRDSDGESSEELEKGEERRGKGNVNRERNPRSRKHDEYAQDYPAPFDVDEEEREMETGEYTGRRMERRKRRTSPEQQDGSAPAQAAPGRELVSLRATQIRTFLLWLHDERARPARS